MVCVRAMKEASAVIVVLLLVVTRKKVVSFCETVEAKQVRALESLNIPTRKEACECDTSTPFRHLTSLQVSNCTPSHRSLSLAALKSLSTLRSLHLLNCPFTHLTLSFTNIHASAPYVLLSHIPSGGDYDDYDDSDYDDDDDDSIIHQKEHHHGPNKLVLGVAIALSSTVFLIVFLILFSKCCR
ncbi:hypothetical protein VNO78_11370 [Psophocarpus tetragonolobus]|uniref:Uncharacterized protein n=1 Tax=Psophocarpus tetragonolobus TaxID=3891 RepID=A0AAN9SNV1_PSOTE